LTNAPNGEGASVAGVNTKWQVLIGVGLLVAALNGNWLLSRRSNGASALLLTGVWVEIAFGLAVAWWAFRRMKAAAPSHSTT
jgi:hypothetical protein